MSYFRILALDYGTKRIGLSLGDTENRIASPHGVIENKGSAFVIDKILGFCLEWGVSRIVLGLPINMDDTLENEMVFNVRSFLVELRDVIKSRELDLNVELFDERLTSFEAGELMGEYPEFFKNKRSCKDELAAQILLTRYFLKNF